MKASDKSDGSSSDPFHVKNWTKQICVMASVLFANNFTLVLEYTFGDFNNGILFEFRSTGSFLITKYSTLGVGGKCFGSSCLQMMRFC